MSHPSYRDHLTAMAALAKKLHMSYGNLRAAVDRGEIPDPAPELRKDWDPLPALKEEPETSPPEHKFASLAEQTRTCPFCGTTFTPYRPNHTVCKNPDCQKRRNRQYYRQRVLKNNSEKEGEPNGL